MRDIETPDTPKINLVISIDNRVASNFTNILEEVVGGDEALRDSALPPEGKEVEKA